MKKSTLVAYTLTIASLLAFSPDHLSGKTFYLPDASLKSVPKSGVQFKTNNPVLQKIFDEAEKKAQWNINSFGSYKVLVEGAGYKNVWLETQPIGGCMYAKRDVEIARNNQLIFMDLQRADGRFPGAIGFKDGALKPRYQELQGDYLPLEAFDVYFWIGKDSEYLKKLYASIEKYDNYLWKFRDSDNNGCLEAWGAGDTGEDHCTRFGKSYHSWMFDYAPTVENLKKMSKADSTQLCMDGCNKGISKNPTNALEYQTPMPIESMDMMSYSYGNRIVLAQIAKILQNGQANYWNKKAKEVQAKLKSYLWNERKHACYDRDKNNTAIDILTHNNLRCMYFGSFDQKMADAFVKYHLMNPDEFWTPMPMPAIAANDPAFRNIPGNNWSGQPQGLIYQRSFRALENYGHYAELSLIGEKFLKVIGDSLKFTQQFDPFSGTINNSSDGYGPSILSSLEFISRMYGIQLSQDKVLWSCLDTKNQYDYTQQLGNREFKLTTKDNRVHCSINGKEVFSFTKGIRIVSDLDGNILEAVGIDTEDKMVEITDHKKTISLSVAPNTVYAYQNKFRKVKAVEFCKPVK